MVRAAPVALPLPLSHFTEPGGFRSHASRCCGGDMKPPPRRRAAPTRYLGETTELPRVPWSAREKRRLLRLLQARRNQQEPDAAELARELPGRSEHEIQDFIRLLKSRVAREAIQRVHSGSAQHQEEQTPAPIEVWLDLAEKLSGPLEEALAAAFSQVLTIAATEPLSLLHSQPPKPTKARGRQLLFSTPAEQEDTAGLAPKPLSSTPLALNPAPHPSGLFPKLVGSALGAPGLASKPSDPAPGAPGSAPKSSGSTQGTPGAASKASDPAPGAPGPSGFSQGSPGPASTPGPMLELSGFNKGAPGLTRRPPDPAPGSPGFTNGMSSPAPKSLGPAPGMSDPAPEPSDFTNGTPNPVPKPPGPAPESSGFTNGVPGHAHRPPDPAPAPDHALERAWELDFEKIYKYLASVSRGSQGPQLSATESAVVLDLLLALPEELAHLPCSALAEHLLETYARLTAPEPCTAEGASPLVEEEVAQTIPHQDPQNAGPSALRSPWQVTGICPLNPFLVSLELLGRVDTAAR